MPKRRPIFEYKGLAGLFGSSISSSSFDDFFSLFSSSSRRRRLRRRRHRRSKHTNHRNRRKHHYSRRAHYAADQRYRRRRYEGSLRRGTPYSEDGSQGRLRTRFADDLPGSIPDDLRSRSSQTSGMRTPRVDVLPSPMHPRGRRVSSPHPLKHPAGYGEQPRLQDHPNGTYLSPEGGSRGREGMTHPTGYLGSYNPAERAVDPELEHSFSPSGLPLQPDADEDLTSGALSRRQPDSERRHEGSGRHRHARRRRKRRSKHRGRKDLGFLSFGKRKRKRHRDSSEESSGERSNDSEQSGEIRDSTKSGKGKKNKKSESDESKKDETENKPNLKKWALIGATLLAGGIAAKKMWSRRQKKKAQQQPGASGEHFGVGGPMDSSSGELSYGSNPLQLPIPKSSFYVKAPENEAIIVERGGKYDRKLNPGGHFLTPFFDRVAFRLSLKEASMVVPAQQCYTRDNVSVTVSASLFVKIEDPVAAAYGVDDAYQSLLHMAQIGLTKETARLSVEQVLQDREGLSDRILRNMNRASRPWGVRCTRFEICDLDIPEQVRWALGRQAEIERQVRADVLASRGARETMQNKADGELHAQMRMSQARQIDAVNKAIGEAHAISERGEAIAGAMRDVAEVVNEPGGEKAMQMRIAEQYIRSYANVAKQQDHLPPAPTPADMAAAMSNAMGLLKNLGEPGSTVENVNTVIDSTSPENPKAQQNEGSYSKPGKGTPPTASHSSGVSPGHPTQLVKPDAHDEMLSTNSQISHVPENSSNHQDHTRGSRASSHTSRTNSAGGPFVSAFQPPEGGYLGPSYPQASGVH